MPKPKSRERLPVPAPPPLVGPAGDGAVLAVAYLRVSTRDKQNLENQSRAIEGLIADRGWVLLDTYQDKESGSAGTEKRKEFDRLMRDAEAGRFQVVVVWSLDRFSREGPYKTFQHLDRLKSAGVGFVSVTEQCLDTMGPFAEVMIALFAVIAKQERLRLRERVKAGLETARGRGVQLGRRKVAVDEFMLKSLVAERHGVREIARRMKLSPTTVSRALKGMKE